MSAEAGEGPGVPPGVPAAVLDELFGPDVTMEEDQLQQPLQHSQAADAPSSTSEEPSAVPAAEPSAAPAPAPSRLYQPQTLKQACINALCVYRDMLGEMPRRGHVDKGKTERSASGPFL